MRIERLLRRMRARWETLLCGALGHEVARNARRACCYHCGWYVDLT